MYIVTGYNKDKYSAELYEPTVFNKKENAINKAIDLFIDFVANQCDRDYDDDDSTVLNIADEFEPVGTFDGETIKLNDGAITVKNLRSALVHSGMANFFATTSYNDYFAELDVSEINAPND